MSSGGEREFGQSGVVRAGGSSVSIPLLPEHWRPLIRTIVFVICLRRKTRPSLERWGACVGLGELISRSMPALSPSLSVGVHIFTCEKKDGKVGWGSLAPPDKYNTRLILTHFSRKYRLLLSYFWK